MTRLLLRRCLALLSIVLLTGVLGGAAVAKQDVKVELFYSGIWNDHTADAYVRDGISISHGAGNEQTGLVPSEASLTFQGRDGRLNPANIRSPLHGLIGRNTPIRISVGGDVRFSGEVVSWKPRRAVKGDAWVHVVAGGTIRRLGQGEPPVTSALRRTILGKALLPHAYWPMEDEAGTTQFASVLSGGPALTGGVSGGIIVIGSEPNTVTAAAESTMPGSLPVAVFNATAILTGQIPIYTDSGQWVWFQMVRMPTANDGLDVQQIVTLRTNSASLPSIAIDLNLLSYQLEIRTFTDTGELVDIITDPIDGGSSAVLDKWLMVAVASQDGADTLTGRLYDLDGTEIANASGTVGAAFHSTMRNFTLRAPSATTKSAQGHAGLYTSAGFTIGTDEALIARAAGGYRDEKAGPRFTRLCLEEGITSTIVGTSAETQSMGPQFPDTTLGLLREIKATDNGMIFDTRSQLGLTLRTGRSLYNQ